MLKTKPRVSHLGKCSATGLHIPACQQKLVFFQVWKLKNPRLRQPAGGASGEGCSQLAVIWLLVLHPHMMEGRRAKEPSWIHLAL
jgi:hypothetical protein